VATLGAENRKKGPKFARLLLGYTLS